MRFFSPKQVAELLSVTPDTVRRWADAGRFGPAWRCLDLGGDLRIPSPEVARFLVSSSRVPVPAAQRSAYTRELSRTLASVDTSTIGGPHHD